MKTNLKKILGLGSIAIALFLNLSTPLSAKLPGKQTQNLPQTKENISENQSVTLEDSAQRKQCIDNYLKNNQKLSPEDADTWCAYRDECISESNNQGLPEDISILLCDCSLAEFMAKYSLEEFENLNEEAETNEKAAEALTDVGIACFEKILYEE